MEREVFYQLCDLLQTKYSLETGRKVSVQEQVAIFCILLAVTFETKMSKKDFNIPAKLFQNTSRRC